MLFVAGCEENQGKFHARFDHIKDPEELRRFLEDVETVEPLLRRAADHEVRTTAPLDEVVTTILRLVDA